MIRQTQRHLVGERRDFPELSGDCFAACIASILEMPIDGFPNFQHHDGDRDGDWWRRWQAFLWEEFRHFLVYYDVETDPDSWAGYAGFWIAGHDTPGDVRHSTVWAGDTLVHNPWPGGLLTGLDLKDAVVPLSIAGDLDRVERALQTKED